KRTDHLSGYREARLIQASPKRGNFIQSAPPLSSQAALFPPSAPRYSPVVHPRDDPDILFLRPTAEAGWSMRDGTQFWLGALLAMVLSCAARAQLPPGDPVDELRRVLSDPSVDLAHHNHALERCVAQLTNLDDLRRALALRE